VNIVRTVARKSSIGGFTFVQGCLAFEKLTKTPLIYSISYFNSGVLEVCFAGLSPPKPPVATGLNIVKHDLALLFTRDT